MLYIIQHNCVHKREEMKCDFSKQNLASEKWQEGWSHSVSLIIPKMKYFCMNWYESSGSATGIETEKRLGRRVSVTYIMRLFANAFFLPPSGLFLSFVSAVIKLTFFKSLPTSGCFISHSFPWTDPFSSILPPNQQFKSVVNYILSSTGQTSFGNKWVSK